MQIICIDAAFRVWIMVDNRKFIEAILRRNELNVGTYDKLQNCYYNLYLSDGSNLQTLGLDSLIGSQIYYLHLDYW